MSQALNGITNPIDQCDFRGKVCLSIGWWLSGPAEKAPNSSQCIDGCVIRAFSGRQMSSWLICLCVIRSYVFFPTKEAGSCTPGEQYDQYNQHASINWMALRELLAYNVLLNVNRGSGCEKKDQNREKLQTCRRRRQ